MEKITIFKLRVTSYKLQVLLAAFVLSAFCFLPFSVFAQDCDYSGTTGPLEWCLKDGILTISGEGEMPDYSIFGAPWYPYQASIYTVIMGNSVTSIGTFAFCGCSSLDSVTIPIGVTSIGNDAFYGCSSLLSVNIPTGVTTIRGGTFYNCTSLTSVIIPNGVTIIGDQAFDGCHSLSSVNIPNSVTIIEYSAFAYCHSLDSVTIPSSVTTIESEVFYGCNLASINSNAIIPPELGDKTFFGTSTSISVKIPCLTYDSYSNAPGWNIFTNYVPDGTVSPPTYYSAKCYFPYGDNNFTGLNSAGIYRITLENSVGCDSAVFLTLIEKPQPQLCMISVDVNNHNEIVWKFMEEVSAYNIYREGTQTGQFDLLATINPNDPNIWVDTESNAKMRSYRYKISAKDTWNTESELSINHKTMHLTINAGQNNSWNLIWTAYEGAEYSTYNIYRALGETPGEFTLIGTIPAGNTSFSDFDAPIGYVYYIVEIMLNETCNIGKGSAIKSNMATNNPNIGVAELPITIYDLQVYPNPTTGELRMEVAGQARNDVVNVEIFNVFGRLLKSKIVNLKLKLIFRTFPPGFTL